MHDRNLHEIAISRPSCCWHSLTLRIAPSSAGPGTILTDQYCLLPGDLRQAHEVLGKLQQAGLRPDEPTLLLAECVLVYMEPQHSSALVAALGQLLSTAAFVIYEQVGAQQQECLQPWRRLWSATTVIEIHGWAVLSLACLQVSPDDAFGRQMLINLEVGSFLHGLQAYGACISRPDMCRSDFSA